MICVSGVAFANLFVYCYFGQFATNNGLKLYDHLYKMDWYNLPLPIQNCVILMLANTERKLIYEGFHMVDLNLLLFGKVKTFFFIDFKQKML